MTGQTISRWPVLCWVFSYASYTKTKTFLEKEKHEPKPPAH